MEEAEVSEATSGGITKKGKSACPEDAIEEPSDGEYSSELEEDNEEDSDGGSHPDSVVETGEDGFVKSAQRAKRYTTRNPP